MLLCVPEKANENSPVPFQASSACPHIRKEIVRKVPPEFPKENRENRFPFSQAEISSTPVSFFLINKKLIIKEIPCSA